MAFDGVGTGETARPDRSAAHILREHFRFDCPSRLFLSMRWIEHGPLWLFRRRKTAGTVLGYMRDELNRRGFTVGPTVGDVMEAINGLTRDALHQLACSCNGPYVSGATVANRLSLVIAGYYKKEWTKG